MWLQRIPGVCCLIAQGVTMAGCEFGNRKRWIGIVNLFRIHGFFRFVLLIAMMVYTLQAVATVVPMQLPDTVYQPVLAESCHGKKVSAAKADIMAKSVSVTAGDCCHDKCSDNCFMLLCNAGHALISSAFVISIVMHRTAVDSIAAATFPWFPQNLDRPPIFR